MKTQYYGAASLDGFIADADHSLDWLFQFEQLEDTSYPEFIEDVGALVMGSTTYEWVVAHLAETGEPWPYDQPAWVFSSRELNPVDGADIRFARGDVTPVHREMAEVAAGRNIWVVGGGELAGQFHDAGLLDELIIQITAVTLGSGAPLLPRRISHPPLRLQAVNRFGENFVELRYEVSYVEDETPAPA